MRCRMRASTTLAMSLAPVRSRDSMAERATSPGSRLASSAVRKVRNSHFAWCDSPAGTGAGGLTGAGRGSGRSGRPGFRSPDHVQGSEMVGIGQVAVPCLGRRELGTVTCQDIGEHSDLLPQIRAGGPGNELCGQKPRRFSLGSR